MSDAPTSRVPRLRGPGRSAPSHHRPSRQWIPADTLLKGPSRTTGSFRRSGVPTPFRRPVASGRARSARRETGLARRSARCTGPALGRGAERPTRQRPVPPRPAGRAAHPRTPWRRGLPLRRPPAVRRRPLRAPPAPRPAPPAATPATARRPRPARRADLQRGRRAAPLHRRAPPMGSPTGEFTEQAGRPPGAAARRAAGEVLPATTPGHGCAAALARGQDCPPGHRGCRDHPPSARPGAEGSRTAPRRPDERDEPRHPEPCPSRHHRVTRPPVAPVMVPRRGGPRGSGHSEAQVAWKAQRLDTLDYFELLGVPTTASAGEVEARLLPGEPGVPPRPLLPPPHRRGLQDRACTTSTSASPRPITVLRDDLRAEISGRRHRARVYPAKLRFDLARLRSRRRRPR